MRRSFFVAAVLAAGCAHKLSDLPKPQRQQSFRLAKDYTRVVTRGAFSTQFVEGLRAGTYTAVAEDDDGIYFKGEGRCVVKLPGDAGDEYLKTGASTKIPFDAGGLYLPKKGSEKPAKLFYVFNPNMDDPAMHAQGPLVAAIISGGDGDVLFLDYDSEKTFLTSLKIVDR